MRSHATHLLRLIARYRLDDRYTAVAQLRTLAEMGKLSETQAPTYLRWLELLARGVEAQRNYLERAPTLDELYPHSPPDVALGLLEEGDGVPLGLSLTGAMNCIFAGRAGSGKTTAMRNLMVAVHEWNQRHPDRRVTIICLDRKGGDYADLPRRLGDEWLHLSADESLRLGLNAPAGCPPRAWINACSTFIAARGGLMASASCLANMIDFLVTAMNPEPVAPLVWPSFELLLELAKTAPLTLFASKPDYEKTLIQMLDGLVHASGTLFQAGRGLDIEEHIIGSGKNVVIDMCGLSPPWVRVLLGDLLLSHLLLGRQYRYQRRGTIDTLFVMDEADPDTGRKAEAAFPDGLSPISMCLKQGRESGLAVCLGLSALGPTARMILTNANHHFFFALGDAESLQEASSTLVLPADAEAIFPALEPGQCVYRGPGPWPGAMLARIHELPPSRTPRPSRFDTHPYVPSKRLSELPHVVEALKRLIAEEGRLKARQAQYRSDGLMPKARKLLDTAGAHPFTPVARLWDRIGKAPFSTQKAVRAVLEKEHLATFEEIRIGRTNVLLMDILLEGWRLLRRKPPARKGRGGIAHRHFAHWIAMVGEHRGHEATCEWNVPGTNHPVDTAWHVEDAWHAFEVVVTCEDNLAAHLTACLINSEAVETVTIVSPQKSLRDKLQRSVASEMLLAPILERVKFEVIETYLKELWPR